MSIIREGVMKASCGNFRSAILSSPQIKWKSSETMIKQAIKIEKMGFPVKEITFWPLHVKKNFPVEKLEELFKNCRSIENINLSLLNIDDAFLFQMGRIMQEQQLNISCIGLFYLDWITDEGVRELSDLSDVSQLEIYGCPKVRRDVTGGKTFIHPRGGY